jgi:hypothetical protein
MTDNNSPVLALAQAKRFRGLVEQSLIQSKKRLDRESAELSTAENDLQSLKARREACVHTAAALHHNDSAHEKAVDDAASIEALVTRAAVKIEIAKIRLAKASDEYNGLKISFERAVNATTDAANAVFCANMEAKAARVFRALEMYKTEVREMGEMQASDGAPPMHKAMPTIANFIQDELARAEPQGLDRPNNYTRPTSGKTFGQLIAEIIGSVPESADA